MQETYIEVEVELYLKVEIPMERVSMLDFRRDAEGVIRRAQQGKRMILTYRGKPVLLLQPIPQEDVKGDDPFYSIDQLATHEGAPLSNDEMDQAIYEQ